MARPGRAAAAVLLLAALGEGSRGEHRRGARPIKAQALVEVARANATQGLSTLHFASARTHFSIPCSAAEGVECGDAATLNLHGPDVASACKVDEQVSNFKRLFKVKKWFDSDNDCSGDTQYSKTRSKVTINGEPYLCCLCPPHATWSSLSNRCICPHSGPGELAPVPVPVPGKKKATVGVCFESADTAMVAQARRVSGGDKARAVAAAGTNTTKDLPALQQLSMAKDWCRIHRELDEVAPAADYGDYVVRMGLGIDAGAWGFIYGVGIQVIDVLDFDAEIDLAEVPGQGLTLSFANKAKPSIEVGIGEITLFLDNGVKKVWSSNDDKYVLKVGGKFSGSDLVSKIKDFGSATGISFTVLPESYRLGRLHSDLTTVKLLPQALIDSFKSTILSAIEYQVVWQLSAKLFSLIALNADSLLKDFKSAYDGVTPYPLHIDFKTRAANGPDVKVGVQVTGGTLNSNKVIPLGLANPLVELRVATAAADRLTLHGDVTTGLETKAFLEAQASSSLAAMMRAALAGPSYDEEVAQLGQQAAATGGDSTSTTARCSREKVRDHRMGFVYESWAGLTRWGLGTTASVGGTVVGGLSGAWSWAKQKTGYGPTRTYAAELLNPGEARAEFEARIYDLWLSSRGGGDDPSASLVGMMSRTVTPTDPQYYMIGLAAPELAIAGNLEVTVAGHGRASIAGTLTVSKLKFPKVLYDSLGKEGDGTPKWQGAYVDHLTNLKIKESAPLTVEVTSEVVDDKISLCAQITSEMRIDYGLVGFAVNLVAKAYEDMLKQLVEDILESTLSGVVGSVVSHFHKQGLKSLTINLNLDSTSSATITLDGEGSYSALGNNQARKAAIPVEVQPPLGRAWAELWSRTAVSAADLRRLSPKLSLEPEAWVRGGWAYAVDALLSGMDVLVTADSSPEKDHALVVTGALDLNLPNIIRPFANDQGVWFYGNHLAAAGMVRFMHRNTAEKMTKAVGVDLASHLSWEAVVSCGSIYFIESEARSYIIAKRRSEKWTTDLTGNGAEGASFVPMPADYKDPCPGGGFSGFVGRSDAGHKYSVCITTGSTLHKAVLYELSRRGAIGEMLASGTFSGSEPWDVMGTAAQTQPFEWQGQESLDGRCGDEVIKCENYFLCQGVASGRDPITDEAVCEYVSFAEVHELVASGGRVAWKRWSVGPPNQEL